MHVAALRSLSRGTEAKAEWSHSLFFYTTPCLPAPSPLHVWGEGEAVTQGRSGEEGGWGGVDRQRSDHHKKKAWYYLKLCKTQIVVEIR